MIIWLGKATPDIDRVLEEIRIAGIAAKEPTIPTRNENTILVLVKAAWFKRI